MCHMFSEHIRKFLKKKSLWTYHESPKWMQGPFWKIPIDGKIQYNISVVSLKSTKLLLYQTYSNCTVLFIS